MVAEAEVGIDIILVVAIRLVATKVEVVVSILIIEVAYPIPIPTTVRCNMQHNRIRRNLYRTMATQLSFTHVGPEHRCSHGFE